MQNQLSKAGREAQFPWSLRRLPAACRRPCLAPLRASAQSGLHDHTLQAESAVQSREGVSVPVVLTTMTCSLTAPVAGAGERQQTRLVHGALGPVAFDSDHHRRTPRPSVERIGRKALHRQKKNFLHADTDRPSKFPRDKANL